MKILETCEEIHMSCTGASDDFGSVAIAQRVEFLKAKIATWKASPHFSSTYDNAVKELMKAAIEEGTNYLKSTG